MAIAVRRPLSMYSRDNCRVLNFPFTIAAYTHNLTIFTVIVLIVLMVAGAFCLLNNNYGLLISVF